MESTQMSISLKKGGDKLSSEENLRIPVAAKNQINIKRGTVKFQNGCAINGAIGSVITGVVVNTSFLTQKGAKIVKKPKRGIEIELEDSKNGRQMLYSYDAGDAFYFICPNMEEEVCLLLERLGLIDDADKELQLLIEDNDDRFPYIPPQCSYRYLFTYCLDIRRSPSRQLLRVLSDTAQNKSEQRRLLELCSVQGTSEFTALVRQSGITLLELLLSFPSCQPSVASLIDHLPRFMPRAYSVSNYKTWRSERVLRFVYSLMKLKSNCEEITFSKYGVCSGWLNSLNVGDTVQLILKEPSKFRLPPVLKPDLDITRCPLILVGPGTGIAPFISFLHKIRAKLLESNQPGATRRFLFYGSSDLTEEYLFKEELMEFQKEKILTDLIICESRPANVAEEPRPKYVYDALEIFADVIVNMLTNSSEYPALLYSCGDVKNMSKTMWSCLADILVKKCEFTRPKAIELLSQLRTSERFIEDVWS